MTIHRASWLLHRPAAILRRCHRQLRFRMMVPLRRCRQAPEPAIRATMIGLGLAFTPTFGLRMPLVFAIWLITRHLLGWHFNLALALAWTWTTNALVTLPLYFSFFITGRLLLGQWQDLSGYAEIASLLAADQPFLAKIQHLFLDWGFTLWLGALPWAILMACLGYHGSRRLLRRRSVRRLPRPA